jgi:hypothetical protein
MVMCTESLVRNYFDIGLGGQKAGWRGRGFSGIVADGFSEALEVGPSVDKQGSHLPSGSSRTSGASELYKS